MRVLSVDLGTSNTVAVLAAYGRPPRVVEVDGSATMPSAVFAGEDGALTVGREAERRARLDPSRYEPNPKRRVDEGTLLLGDAVVPVTDALAAVLKRVADETSRQLGGARPDEVRLTHPAQWGPVRRNVLLSAARQAGLGSKLLLVPEPVAAAAHFASFPGQSLSPGQALAVYDLGAGTFDVAVVGATQKSFTVLAEAGLPDLGGLDVDQALLEHVGRQVSHREPGRWQRLLRPESTGDRRAQRTLREDIKAAKEALSSHAQTEVPMPEPFEDVLVTRAELESLVRPNLLRSVELLGNTVRSTGMTPDRLAGIYLVGGSSRMPLVATLIAEQLRVVPTTLDQPETAVALGAQQSGGDGASLRGQGPDMAGGLAEDQPTRAITPTPVRPPVPGPKPAGFPGIGMAPAFPSSGPQRVAQPPAPARIPQYAPHQYPQPAQLVVARKSTRKAWLIAAGAFAVVVAAVVGVVLATSSGDNKTVTQGSGGGGYSAAAGSGSAECVSQQQDAQGFTSCLRELAGPVPGTFQCAAGMSATGGTQMTFPGATVVTCNRDTYQVIYMQMSSEDIVRQSVETVLEQFNMGNAQATDWQGGDIEGKYYNYDLGYGAGIGMFTVTGKPLLGMILNTNASPTGSSSASTGSLQSFFEEEVKPR